MMQRVADGLLLQEPPKGMGKAGKTGENAVHEIMQLVADGLLLREPPKETEKAGETEENAPRWGHHPRLLISFGKPRKARHTMRI